MIGQEPVINILFRRLKLFLIDKEYNSITRNKDFTVEIEVSGESIISYDNKISFMIGR